MSLDLLRALQLADSGFPSGAFAYSWGLERAIEHGHVTRTTFGTWLAVEMLGRWAEFDRIVLADAWRAKDPLRVDRDTDILFMAEPLRIQSAEAGQALLAAASRLGDPVAKQYRVTIADGDAAGHLPVAQGAVFRSMGLGLEMALATSAHAAAQGLASAAVRLGLLGALQAQACLRNIHPDLAQMTTAPPPGALPASFAPISEIAMMHASDGRLFAN